jgi:hypothetical protein
MRVPAVVYLFFWPIEHFSVYFGHHETIHPTLMIRWEPTLHDRTNFGFHPSRLCSAVFHRAMSEPLRSYPILTFQPGNSNGVFTHGRLRPSKFIPGNYLFTCSTTDQKTLKLSFAMRSFLHSCNLHHSPQRKLRFTFLTLASRRPRIPSFIPPRSFAALRLKLSQSGFINSTNAKRRPTKRQITRSSMATQCCHDEARSKPIGQPTYQARNSLYVISQISSSLSESLEA